MQYHGFPTLSAYEAECARLGFTTRRVVVTSSIPLASGQAQKLAHSAVPPLPTEPAALGFGGDPQNGEAYFFLVTSPPGHPTGTSVESWTLFSADETRQLLDGVNNGVPENYLGKLAAHGCLPAPVEKAPEQILSDDGFGQLLLPI